MGGYTLDARDAYASEAEADAAEAVREAEFYIKQLEKQKEDLRSQLESRVQQVSSWKKTLEDEKKHGDQLRNQLKSAEPKMSRVFMADLAGSTPGSGFRTTCNTLDTPSTSTDQRCSRRSSSSTVIR